MKPGRQVAAVSGRSAAGLAGVDGEIRRLCASPTRGPPGPSQFMTRHQPCQMASQVMAGMRCPETQSTTTACARSTPCRRRSYWRRGLQPRLPRLRRRPTRSRVDERAGILRTGNPRQGRTHLWKPAECSHMASSKYGATSTRHASPPARRHARKPRAQDRRV